MGERAISRSVMFCNSSLSSTDWGPREDILRIAVTFLRISGRAACWQLVVLKLPGFDLCHCCRALSCRLCCNFWVLARA